MHGRDVSAPAVPADLDTARDIALLSYRRFLAAEVSFTFDRSAALPPTPRITTPPEPRPAGPARAPHGGPPVAPAHPRPTRWVKIGDRIVAVLVRGVVPVLVGGVVLALVVLLAAGLLNSSGVRTPIRNLELSDFSSQPAGIAPPCSGPIEVWLVGSITLDDAATVGFGWHQDDELFEGGQDRYYPAGGTFGFDFGMLVVRPAPGRTAGFVSFSADPSSAMVGDGSATTQVLWRCQAQ